MTKQVALLALVLSSSAVTVHAQSGAASRTKSIVGPAGYLRPATLSAHADTLDTFDSPRGSGPIIRGNGAFVVRSVRQVSDQRWETTDIWHDSTGKVTANQYARTARGSLAIELETVRALRDSASMLVAPDRATGWVVPAGQPAHLFDGMPTTQWFAESMVSMALAKSHPVVGSIFLAPQHSLYGANPIETRMDSLQVMRRDTLYRGQTPLPVLVIGHANGGEIWIEASTGIELLSRGNAAPGHWWWHIVRGVRTPAVK